MPQKQTRLARTEIDALVEARAAGSTVEELARRFKIHRTTVIAHLAREEVPPRTFGLHPDHHDEVVDLHKAGWSLARLRERLGADNETIRRHLVRNGVQIRPKGRRRQHP